MFRRCSRLNWLDESQLDLVSLSAEQSTRFGYYDSKRAMLRNPLYLISPHLVGKITVSIAFVFLGLHLKNKRKFVTNQTMT